MPKSQIKKIFTVTIISLVFILTGTSQTSEQSTTSTPTPICTGAGCAEMSRAELFIKSFGGKKGLRTSDLEQEEKVKNAFYGIDATRVEVEKGRLTKQEGDFIIDGHQQVIRDYVHDKGNDAKITALSGQVSDIPAITKSLGNLLSVARQDSLMGREEVALRAQAEIFTVLRTFSGQFANTCEKQNYSVETALALERQNQLIETGISLEHCLKRKVTAKFSDLGVNYVFEGCSDLTEEVDWDLKISGRVNGTGKGGGNIWEANFTYKNQKFEDVVGKLENFTKEIEVEEEPVKVPNDAGPLAKANGRPSAPIPKIRNTKKVQIPKMRIKAVFADYKGEFYGGSGDGKWLETEVKREDKPCSPKA